MAPTWSVASRLAGVGLAGVTPGAQAPDALYPPHSSQMVGIGTSDVDLDKYHHTFCSLLGRDEDSWGLSYTGMRGPEGRQRTGVGVATRRQQGSPHRPVPQVSSITKAIR